MNEKLSQELLRLLNRLNEGDAESVPPTKKATCWALLNSAFSITVLSGLVIGCLSMLLQAEITRVHDTLAHRQELRAKRMLVMSEFADGMDRWFGGSQGVIRTGDMDQPEPTDYEQNVSRHAIIHPNVRGL